MCGRQDRHDSARTRLVSAAKGWRSTVRMSIERVVRQAGQRTQRNPMPRRESTADRRREQHRHPLGLPFITMFNIEGFSCINQTRPASSGDEVEVALKRPALIGLIIFGFIAITGASAVAMPAEGAAIRQASAALSPVTKAWCGWRHHCGWLGCSKRWGCWNKYP